MAVLEQITKFVVPNKTDLAIGCAAILFLAAAAAAWCGCRYSLWYSVHMLAALYIVWWSMAALILVATGAIVAWRRQSLFWTINVLSICVASVLVNLVVFNLVATDELIAYINEHLHDWLPSFPSVGKLNAAPLTIFPLAFVFGYLPISVCRRIVRLGENRGTPDKPGTKKRNGRATVLITIAILLLIAAFSRNVVVWFFPNLDEGFFAQVILVGLFWLFLYLVCIALPAWAVACGRSWKTKRLIPGLLLVAATLSVVGTVYINGPFIGSEGYMFAAAALGAVYLFAISLFIVVGPPVSVAPVSVAPVSVAPVSVAPVSVESNEGEQENEQARRLSENSAGDRNIPRPGFLTILLAATGCILLFGLMTYDLDTILENPIRINWELARDMKGIKTSKYLEFEDTVYYQNLNCPLDENAPPDLFDGLASTLINVQNVTISGLSPEVDVSQLANIERIGVSDSVITAEQFSDLCSAGNSLSLNNVRISGTIDKESIDALIPPSVLMLDNSTDKNGVPLSLLDSRFVDRTVIISGTRITPVIWEQIFRLGPGYQFSIPLDGTQVLPIDESWCEFVASGQSFSNVWLVPSREQRFDEQAIVRRLVLETDIKISIELSSTTPAEFWNLAYLKPGAVALRVTEYSNQPIVTIEDCHGVFGTNADGETTHLFAPAPIEFAASDSIEVLSLDYEWLVYANAHAYVPLATSRDTLQFEQINDFSVSRFPTLHELYLPRTYRKDFSIETLESMPELEHLQCQSNGNSFRNNSLAKFPKLKSLTIFNDLNSGLLAQLALLPNLTELHNVIAADATPNQQAVELAGIQAALPGVKVKVTLEDQFQPEITAEFKQHIESVAKLLRDELKTPTEPDSAQEENE